MEFPVARYIFIMDSFKDGKRSPNLYEPVFLMYPGGIVIVVRPYLSFRFALLSRKQFLYDPLYFILMRCIYSITL